jgi:hypothetical protein
MPLRPTMTEEEFIEAIDPCLIFETEREYEEAARLGCSISDNAALMVGLVLASGSSHGSLDLNLRLLDILKRERPTRVILAGAPVIESLLKNQASDHTAVSRLMAACEEHSSAWNGLGIVECADESLRTECETIRSAWKTHSNS